MEFYMKIDPQLKQYHGKDHGSRKRVRGKVPTKLVKYKLCW